MARLETSSDDWYKFNEKADKIHRKYSDARTSDEREKWEAYIQKHVMVEEGMKILQKIAPNAPLNLLAVVPRPRFEEDEALVPSVEKMSDLLNIAEKYFEQVKIVEREVRPR